MKVARDVQARPPHPLCRFPAELAGPALAGPVRQVHHRPLTSTVRDEFLKRFFGSVEMGFGAATLAGRHRLARRRWPVPLPLLLRCWMGNGDIAFFFLSQLVLPPVALALPFLVLYRPSWRCSTPRWASIMVYTLSVLPIVIWIMKDQFDTIPIELDEAAQIDGLSSWGTFLRVILPVALPGMVAAFITVVDPLLERIFFRRAAHQQRRPDAACHGGEPDRLARRQLVDDGGAHHRRDRAAGPGRDRARARYISSRASRRESVK